MQDLNANLYRKYTDLKKRKLLHEGTARDREPEIKKMCEALDEMESELQSLRDENSRLRDELLSKERQLAETRTLLVDKEQQLAETRSLSVDTEQQLVEDREISVDDTRKAKEFEDEILRLKLLLAEKNDTDNYTFPSGVIDNHTPVSPAKRTSARELECFRRNMPTSGNGTDESSSSCVYHMLAESIVGMKFSLNNEMEGLSLSIYHEASGYKFTLTWLEEANGGEWAYKCSSLGTLERIALEWMKEQDIRFSMKMCPVLFQKICGVIRS